MAHGHDTSFVQSLVDRAEPDTAWKRLSEDRAQNQEHNRLAFQVATKVLTYLSDQGRTKTWLANQMGVTPQHIGKILKGRQNMTLETIGKLAEATGLTLLEVPEGNAYTAPVFRATVFEGLVPDLRSIFGGTAVERDADCLEFAY